MARSAGRGETASGRIPRPAGCRGCRRGARPGCQRSVRVRRTRFSEPFPVAIDSALAVVTDRQQPRIHEGVAQQEQVITGVWSRGVVACEFLDETGGIDPEL